MMTGLEKRDAAAAKQEEEEMLLMEGMAVLDFDMLCSTVAMQAEKGTWGKLNESNEDEEEAILFRNNENGGGVFRMWEGELIYDCFDHRQIALQSTCCPCYRFGRNMKRAGFGSCFLQGFFYSILLVIALSNLLAFIITRRHFFLYLAIAFTVSIGTYVGFYRSQIKKKFNIKMVFIYATAYMLHREVGLNGKQTNEYMGLKCLVDFGGLRTIEEMELA
ncbi:unnamed protein product [Fraxinus pennsylvanica]|uniref:Uncharacterized protein n=1 Tax=Fraxinus pennsylvanica TaxID=56036 RepID=A0AAD1YTY3_9LAMI|nr:unnamed protein product [Fraxinus pennsylvanica]